FVALLLASSLVLAQQPYPLGPPLGPMINGTDFSGSWVPARFQDAGLGTAAGALVDYGGISLNDASGFMRSLGLHRGKRSNSTNAWVMFHPISGMHREITGFGKPEIRIRND